MNFKKNNKKLIQNVGSALVNMAMLASPLSVGAAANAYYASRRLNFNKNKSSLVENSLNTFDFEHFKNKRKYNTTSSNINALLVDAELKISSNKAIRELVIIDSNIKNSNLYSKLTKPGVEVVNIDSRVCGYDELVNVLNEYRDLEAVHLFVHKKGNQVKLGESYIATNTLQNNLQNFNYYNNFISKNGSFLIHNTELEKNNQLKIIGGNYSTSTPKDEIINRDVNLKIKKGNIKATPNEGSIALNNINEMFTSATFDFSAGDMVDFGGSTPSDDVILNESGPTSNYVMILNGASQGVTSYYGRTYGYVGYDGSIGKETSLTISLQGGESFDPTELYLQNFTYSEGSPITFTFASDVSGTATSTLAAGSGETVSLANLAPNTKVITLTASSSFKAGLDDIDLTNITLASANSAPTDISLSTTSVGQSSTGVNATVATLSTTDADAGDTHTYSLVSGTGDSGNANFNINGSSLRTNGALMAGTYSIRVNTNDGTDDFAKQLSITISDDIAPVVTSVSVPSNDTYDVSENLDFTVNFNENITVNTAGGTPQLALTIGSTTRQASYLSGTGSQNIVFRYTVQSGDIDIDGIAVGTLSANSGTLQDAAGNNANLNLNSVGSTANVFAYTSDVTYTTANGFLPANPSGLDLTNYDLTIQDGTAVISSTTTFNNVTVQPNAILDVNANISVVGELRFESDATGSALLNDATGISITGDVTVERFIPGKRAYRLLSSPVGGQTFANTWQQDTHITGAAGIVGQTSADGFDETETGNPSLFTFDNTITDQSSGAGWQAIANTNATDLDAGTPYRLMVRGDRTIDLADNEASATATTLSASGSLQTGSYTPTLATAANNYSFVGNPYQAVVDFGAVTKSNLTDFIYVWDASIAGSNGNGGYTVVDASDGSEAAPSPYSSAANQYIMPGQAFFVQNNASGNGSITFEEADKATGEPQVSIFSTYTNFYINSRLYKASALQNGEMESDAIGLRFNENYTTIGSDEDASKLANPGENYAIVNNGFKSIDKQNIPTDGHQVDLLMMNYEDTAYSLSFNLGNQPETLKVYLNDSYLNTQTELTESTTYDFTVDANVPESIDQNRFHLSFEEVPLNNQSFDAGQVRLYPNPVVHQLQIELPASVEINSVQVFNTLGQQVLTTTQSQVDVSQLASGVYVVELETTKGKVSKKIIKQ